ncbi:MAG: trypsin-like peptidase domain-containing protein [Oscillospiraceae bacterium]|nr:trypsin-like peptidase domain-containing protein [Oscillospiraceae bacterium]
MYNEYDNDMPESGTVDNEAIDTAPEAPAEPVSEPENGYFKAEPYTPPHIPAPDYFKPGIAGQPSADEPRYEGKPAEMPSESAPYRARDPWSGGERTYKEPWKDPVYSKPENSYSYTPGIHPQQYSQQTQRTEPAKKKKSHFFLKAVCLVLVCALVSAGASYAVVTSVVKSNRIESAAPKTIVIGSNASETSDSSKETAADRVVSTGEEMLAEDLYQMACDQVVGIRTSITTTNIFGQTTSGAVSGSGFIISNDGYIVTNYHVIEYSATYGYELTVLLHDGSSYAAKIVGYEADNDIAVIKIDATGLSAVRFGSSENVSVGTTVYAIGNALGELEYTMTSGIVSALDRVITTTDSTTNTSQSINMFQIDAAINSGNSGGPVYNSKGEVIGIVTAKYKSTGVEGLGFAIPIDDAVEIISDLIENGYVTGKPYFGITVDSITASYAQYYGLVEGALIRSVTKGSCAANAGLEPGDIITKLGDTEIKSKNELLAAKKDFKAGDTTEIVVYRNGEYLTFVITFDEEPAEVATATNQQQQQSQQSQGGWGNFGSIPFAS